MNLDLEPAIYFFGILAATIVAGTLLNRFFIRLIRRSTEEMQTDPTNYQFFRRILVVMVYVVGFSIAIFMLPGMRTLASSMLAGAGIAAAAVGFASQQALSNIVGGVFIVIFKPFRVNDRLNIKGMNGIVEDITLRHTVIRDFENRRIVIPNSIISQEVIINADYRDEKICKWIEVGISYDSDIDRAKAIMREEVLNHPLRIDHRTPEQIEEGVEEVPVRVILLGDFAVTLRAWAWAKNAADAFQMQCDLLESIKKRFDAEGIEIPFPYRTLVFKNPLPNLPAEMK
ncbi:MAG: mechanosensitive ion channel family protein [Bacteroidetes bacterium]|nr:MAG: mechanosensitive ion channel family protein [Bacteroidota bacterium]